MNEKSSSKKLPAPLLLLLHLVPVHAAANPPPGANAEEFVVAFESEPAGAAVRLDGNLLCKETPCQRRVLSGAHEAVFEKGLHEPSSQRFTAAKGMTVKGTLAPMFGWISVETTPSGVGVSIDGSDAGKTPVGWREVDAGEPEVAVSDPCYARSRERVPVKIGERRLVKLTATPRLAGLKVYADDEKGNALETDIVVDGTVAGAAGSTLTVPVCAKKVSVRLGRRETFEQELELEEGKIAVVTAKPSMLRLPGGTYTMGQIRRTVTVAPFVLDVTGVTAAAYRTCVKAGRCSAPGRDQFCNSEKADRASHPVNCVDWNQARSYCAWAGKRLPTEEEWEWAARGAERGTTYPWGNEVPRDQVCWNGGDVQRYSKELGTCAVGTFDAGCSPQGVMDLAGNVSEWTSSAYDSSNRVARGGGWTGSMLESDKALSRGYVPPGYRHSSLGFRCARSP